MKKSAAEADENAKEAGDLTFGRVSSLVLSSILLCTQGRSALTCFGAVCVFCLFELDQMPLFGSKHHHANTLKN
jgi:hypothetical protein